MAKLLMILVVFQPDCFTKHKEAHCLWS